MTVSTHVLDVSIGRPAASVGVTLARLDGDRWIHVSQGSTNADGRVPSLAPGGRSLPSGVYRLSYAAADYFGARQVETFYSTIDVQFVARDASAHYHVPLLVSPYGYSTYRGS